MIFITTTNKRINTSIPGWAANLTDAEYDQVTLAREPEEAAGCRWDCLCNACVADDLEQSDLVQRRALAREEMRD